MAANSVGESDLIFGVTGETWGYITDLQVSEAAETAEATDSDGDIKGVTFFSRRHNVTGTFTHLTTSPLDDDDPRKEVGSGTTISITNASNKLPNYDRTAHFEVIEDRGRVWFRVKMSLIESGRVGAKTIVLTIHITLFFKLP